MAAVELSEKFFSKVAGWEAMKHARQILAAGRVLSSEWNPPLLQGSVQEGSTTFKSGLIIKDAINLENICPCRQSRQWGTICAHSVAVGLHHLQPATVPQTPQAAPAPAPETKPEPLFQTSPEGTPCRIHVVFPPSFFEALWRSKSSLYFEGELDGKRIPLNALSRKESHQFEIPDERLLETLAVLTRGEVPATLSLGPKEAGRLLESLQAHPRLAIGRSSAIQISLDPFCPELKATLTPSGEILLQAAPVEAGVQFFPAGESLWIFQKNRIQPLKVPEAYRSVLQHPLMIARADIPRFLGADWELLNRSTTLEANFSIEDFEVIQMEPEIRLFLRGGLARLEAELKFHYGKLILNAGEKSELLWFADPDDVRRFSSRNPAAEQKAISRLLKAGFEKPPAPGGKWILAGQESVLNFFATVYPRVQSDWKVELEERLEQSTRKNLERVEPRTAILSTGMQWFDFAVKWQTTSGDSISPAEIQRLLRSGRNHSRSSNGRFLLVDTESLEEFQEVLRDANPTQAGEAYRIDEKQAGFLQSTLEKLRWPVQAPSAWKERSGLKSSETEEEEALPLGELESVLRPYQKQGLRWFRFLRRNGFGGILADEMGLGKTVQTLALLTANKRLKATANPSLVVCPTSLLFNWKQEAARFAPELKVLLIEGPGRKERFAAIPQHDLVLTSYGLLRRDMDFYRSLQFDTVILDEAQHIKNRQSQNAQAVKAIPSDHRLVLTGTPLENSVQDLWSIFDFLMPGYLGSAQDFRERYEIPIVKEKHLPSQDRLSRRVRPFLLRREKKEVAPELPEKIDQVVYCDLTPEQKAAYEQVLQETRKELVDAGGAPGDAAKRMFVFNALLRLRQICCDMRLLPLEQSFRDPSAKWDLFGELLEEVLDGGHRVLVFSQFVSMLQLIKERLEAESIPYCYLDGSTTNREEVVSRFQNESSAPVFLISLKAGGVGLNLTAADTVIHFDPWWNPAIEEQATARAHRIGQKRVVTSYKLISRGTVEEKILHLQNRKKEMFRGILGDENSFGNSLSYEEMKELLF